jgi:Tfp pilus assembly protein PilX
MQRNEKGIALVITLFLMATLSALAVSMMFLAQTETASSRNYRTMSQARYGAEAGVQELTNYLMNTAYMPTANVDVTKSPVTCTGGSCAHTTAGTCNPSTIATAISSGCVVLGYSAATSNNPTAAYHVPTSNVLAVNSSGVTNNAAMGTVAFNAVAVLMAQRTITAYGSSSGTIQTWQIVSDGTVPPSTSAIVEVSATLEQSFGSAQTFAIFATGTGCGAISLSGTVQTASYDGSSVSSNGVNVGTTGNMNIQGHVDVHGSLSSPRTGIGNCTNGTNVTALTETGAATVDNNALVTLPQALAFPLPVVPTPLPPTTTMSSGGTACALVYAANPTLLPATWCTYTSGSVNLAYPGSNTVNLGNISGNWTLNGGSYSINSIGSGNLSIPNSTGNVTVNLVGKNSDGTQMANPFNLNGQAVVNNSMNAAKLQVLYAGSGTIDMTGGSNAAMLLYAPAATVVTHGNSDIYGSILSAQVTSAGTPRFIYDTRLQNTVLVPGNYMLSSFSWKKY